MPLTLSPFRYFQLAQHILRAWAEQAPRAALWKGKGRAEPLLPSASGPRLTEASILRASVEERRQSQDASSIAGPSRHGGSYSPSPSPNRPPTLGPDPNLPPQPNEIYRLMNDERLLHPGSVAPPREVVVLCHGERPAKHTSSGRADVCQDYTVFLPPRQYLCFLRSSCITGRRYWKFSGIRWE